jgi:hypothetical protein
MLAPSQLVAPAAVLAAAALNSANTVKLAAEEDKRHYKRQQSAPNMRHKVSKGGSEVKVTKSLFFCQTTKLSYKKYRWEQNFFVLN